MLIELQEKFVKYYVSLWIDFCPLWYLMFDMRGTRVETGLKNHRI